METTDPTRNVATLATALYDPAVEFVDEVVVALLQVWNNETGRPDEKTVLDTKTGREELSDGTTLEEPPEGVIAFYSAVGKIVMALTEDPNHRIKVDSVAIEVHAHKWAVARGDWDTPPIRLSDYTAGEKTHCIFWLILPR